MTPKTSLKSKKMENILLGILCSKGHVSEPRLEGGVEHNAAERVLRLGDNLLDALYWVLYGLEERDSRGVPDQGGFPQPGLDIVGSHTLMNTNISVCPTQSALKFRYLKKKIRIRILSLENRSLGKNAGL